MKKKKVGDTKISKDDISPKMNIQQQKVIHAEGHSFDGHLHGKYSQKTQKIGQKCIITKMQEMSDKNVCECHVSFIFSNATCNTLYPLVRHVVLVGF